MYVKRVHQLEANLEKAYSLIMGQCSEAMKAKLESRENYDDIHRKFDTLKLIIEIDMIIDKYEDNRYDCESYYTAQRGLWSCTQGPDMSDIDYLNKLKAKVDTLESYGIEIGNDKCLLSLHRDYEELDLDNDNINSFLY